MFNTSSPDWMHIDFNSCFATIEQQANPLLRHKPIAVAAYDSPNGCILAPSVEAKEYGVKTGMRVSQGRQLCPQLIVMTGDVRKYRYAHHQLANLMRQYSNEFWPKSIDEFIVNLRGYPALEQGYTQLGLEIKQKIRDTIGEWMRVSIGFGPNRFLAKLAASIRKPDGLLVVDQANYMDIYQTLDLKDLNGIADRNAIRLKLVGIYSVPAFYHASIDTLKKAFGSKVAAHYWHWALRGWQYDAIEYDRRSFSSQYSPPVKIACLHQAEPVAMKLTERTSSRMRQAGFAAQRVQFWAGFKDGSQWSSHRKLKKEIFATQDIYQQVRALMQACPFPAPVRTLAIGCADLVEITDWQYDLFGEIRRKKILTQAIDATNNKFGAYTVTLATMLGTKDLVPDRISFGKVKDT